MKKFIFSIMAMAVCFFISNTAFTKTGDVDLNRYSAVLYNTPESTFFTNGSLQEFYAQIQLLMEKKEPGTLLDVDVSKMSNKNISLLRNLLEAKKEFSTYLFVIDIFEEKVFLLKVEKL